MKKIKPGSGQESVWDYPRPPKLEKVNKHLKVVFNGRLIADTRNGYRVLETSHPPAYYFPVADVSTEVLHPVSGGSFCEWKGRARYFDVIVGNRKAEQAVWTYEDPNDRYSEIAGCFCFYPGKMDACYVDDEKVQAQEGDFYGGWITSNILGPFKGGQGTSRW